MNRNHAHNQCPPIAGGFKLVAGAVVIGLIIAAGASPVDWGLNTVPDVAATGPSDAATTHFPSAFTLEAAETTPHVEAF